MMTGGMRPPTTTLPTSLMLLAALMLLPAAGAFGQESVAVMVDDSPTASQRFGLLLSQRAANPTEAARLAAELLDGFGDRLVAVEDGDGERFRSVRVAVEAVLRSHPELAERHRAAESAMAERLLREGRLEELSRRRLWTDAGLEAALRLAQREAESGQGAAALRMLARIEGHPALEARSKDRAAAIRLVAEWSLGAGGVPQIPEPPPPSRDARSSLDSAVEPPREAASWRRLWVEEMPLSVFRRVLDADSAMPRVAPRMVPRVSEEATLLATFPAADDRAVYIHEGHRLRAIDRLSRRERWQVPLDLAGGDAGGTVGDPAVAVVRDGAVVAISGHALGTMRSGGGRIHCLEASDGSRRWATSLAEAVGARIGDAGQGSEAVFAYGVPAVDGRAAHLLARRVSNRLETVDYLVSLSLEDGSLRWVARLGSAGGIRLGGLRHYTSPLLHEGRIFVSSSVGVVAAVDAADGGVEWLRRIPVPLRESPYPVAAWECGSPVAIGDELFAISPDQLSLLRISASDGRLLAAAPIGSAARRSPRYLLAANGSEGEPMLLSVGGDLEALDPEDLSRRWSFADANEGSNERWPLLSGRSGIRGRVQVGAGAALVPGSGGVAVVRLSDGRIESVLPADEPANPLLDDGQLLLAAKDSLAMLASPEESRRRLQRRWESAPAEAEWPLALLDLELELGRFAEAVSFAAAALRGVEASGDAADRAELFERLVELDRRCLRGDPAEVTVRDLLLAAATEPSQRLRERLGRGEWLMARGRSGEAAEAWRSVLSDREVAAAEWRSGDRRVDGAAAALSRLREAARGDARAREAMERVAAAGGAVPAGAGDAAPADLRFAREHPFTRAATTGFIEVAERRRAAGEPREALWILLEAMQRHGGDATLAAALSQLAIEQGWLATAVSAIRESGGEVPADLLVAASADPWQRSVAGDAAGRPQLGFSPGEAIALPGRIVRPESGRLGEKADRFLLAGDGSLSMWSVSGGPPEERWSLPLEEAGPRLLRAGRDLLLWQPLDGSAPIASRIDASEGRVRWLNPSLDELLPALPQRPFEAEARGAAVEGGSKPSEILPALVEDQLVLVRRSGDLASLSIEDGRTVRWRLEQVLEMVTHLDAGPLGVVLGGRHRDDSGRLVPAVAWVDPDGGVRRRWLVPDAVGGIRWVRLSPLAGIAWGSDAGVSCRQIASGAGEADLEWSAESSALRRTAEGWLLRDRLLLREGPQQLVACGLLDGAPLAEAVGERRDAAPVVFVGLLADAAGVTATYSDRVVRFDARGRFAGMDAVSEDRNYIAFDAVDGGVAVLSSRGTRPAIDASGTPRTEFMHLVYRFSTDDGCRQAGAALEVRTTGPRLEAILCVDGWILLSSAASTIAVPLAP